LRADLASAKGAETYNDAEEESGRKRAREGHCKGEEASAGDEEPTGTASALTALPAKKINKV
jgi:hypothetical protein